MKLKNRKKLMIGLLITILFVSVDTHAEEDDSDGGFSGYIMFGAAYTGSSLALDDPHEDNKIIGSLSSSPRYDSEASPFVVGGINYTFAPTGTTLSLGGEDLGLDVSVSQYGDFLGDFKLGFSLSNDEVYKDPFLTGRKREVADMDSVNYSFTWSDILRTGITAEYSLQSIDLDNDVAGKRNSKLKRDGNIHYLGLDYAVFETEKHQFGAGVSYELGDFSGKSYSYKAPGAELSYSFLKDKWELETELGFVFKDYDEVHPEFNKTRHENIWSLGTTCTYHQPFNINGVFLNAGIYYSKSDSNIDYYDSNSITTMAGIGYSF